MMPNKFITIPNILFATIITIVISHTSLCAMEIGVQAEWSKPKTILMHTPGDEIFYGLLHANAALYEAPFDNQAAQREHRNYIAKLQEQGITVIQVVDTLLRGTLNDDDTPKEGPELEKLIQFASESMMYRMPENWPHDSRVAQERYKQETLQHLHPKTLVRIILERPIVNLRESKEQNTQFIADPYQSHPLMNMYFLRDQQITTAKGVVLGRMNSEQRAQEVNIMAFVFQKLGIKPIYRVMGEGRLEGGDFIPVGDFALIGQGLRTNAEGIRQLLENDVFGFDEVAVVKDPFQHQDQMHLDTYFNILGPKKAIVDTIRRTQGVIIRGNVHRPIRPVVDVYMRTSSGTYECVQKDRDFFDYIEKDKGFEIIDIEDAEQLNYGCNFLCIGPNKIIGVDGVSPRYQALLTSAGVDAKLLNFRNMTKGFGGPHCTTQVLSRSGK